MTDRKDSDAKTSALSAINVNKKFYHKHQALFWPNLNHLTDVEYRKKKLKFQK
jgi:hypothetical protein